MTNDQQVVWDEHPSARVVFNSDSQRFAVFHTVGDKPGGDVHAALSSGWETASMAWAEAAVRIRERNQQLQEQGHGSRATGT